MKCVKTNYLDYEWKSSHGPSQTLTNMVQQLTCTFGHGWTVHVGLHGLNL